MSSSQDSYQAAHTPVWITLHPETPGRPLGNLFGVFFEDLNHAADGGLYAELLANRDFEFDPMDRKTYDALTAWAAIGNAEITVLRDNPPFPANPHYVRIGGKPGYGLCNLGFGRGIAVDAGKACRLTLWGRSSTGSAIACSLAGDDCSFRLTTEWQKYEAILTPGHADNAARLSFTLAEAGEFELAFASLMPLDTWPGKASMLRRDLAGAIAAMHPRFLRFPGGCLTHDGALDPDARDGIYNWKRTLGPVESRPARRNNWGYHQTMGLGFYEYFLFCEDLDCEPLPVVNGGLDPHHLRFAEGEVLQQYIQDALDLIDFAKGGQDTKWGRVRAEMGHPEPFHLRYLAVGNEEIHEQFHQNMTLFAKAIRAKDPDIELIGSSGPFVHGRPYDMGWAYARKDKLDYVDEHYYLAPEWFLANAEHYAAYPTAGPKVFLGEYASGGNRMKNALAEAAYMVGLQNAPAVGMACYAPLLCHAQYINWEPDMLFFDNTRMMKTVNYHVQSMFMRHQGDIAIPVEATENEYGVPYQQELAGKIRILCDETTVRISDIRLTTADGTAIFPDACLNADTPLELAYHQGDFRLEMNLLRLSGKKGIFVRFAETDENNHHQWTIGGWQNSDSAIESRINGHGSCLTQSILSLYNGHCYHLVLEVKNNVITAAVDGDELNQIVEQPLRLKPLYLAGSMDSSTGDCILKAVNVQSCCVTAEIACPAELVTIESLTGDQHAENTFEAPDTISPVTQTVNTGDICSYSFPAYSVTVLRFHKK